MRTVWHEPAAYSWKHDRRRSVESYRQWVDAALAEEQARCPDLFGAPDYVMGFRDGFVDYVYLGGTGEPPPVPPRQFWNVMLRSPEGKVRANLWFDGYRHGAAAARDGGYRELGMVQSSLVGFASGPQYSEDLSSIDGTNAYGANEPLPEGEILPEPPGAAPALTPSIENDDSSRQESYGEPSSQPALISPEFSEPPFGDDPQQPAEENNDQPLSKNAPTPEQLAQQLVAESAGSETPINVGDHQTFDVKPAVLINANDADDHGPNAIVTMGSPASTMRFIGEAPSNNRRAKAVDASLADRRDIRSGFHGWSRRVATESTLHYRTPHAQEYETQAN